MTTQIDFEQARANMIEQQIRTWEVLDQNVLDLMYHVHREDFVPGDYRQLALADMNIPLANGQVMMEPKVEARLLQSLAPRNNESVLEVGTGSAYLTALLASLSGHVESLDIFPDFTRDAKHRLDAYKLGNIELLTRNVFEDWPAGKNYDAIVLTGSVPRLDTIFHERLANGGRLFAIVGEAPVMEAVLVTRHGANEWSSESLFETTLPALVGVKKTSSFKF